MSTIAQQKTMLIKHIRNSDKVPFATIVMLKNGNYGISVCSTKDMYNKKRGVAVALGRAQTRKYDLCSGNVSSRIINYYNNDTENLVDVSMWDVLNGELAKMEVRACKYFKWGKE